MACNAQSPQLVTIDFATASVTSRALPIDGGEPEFGASGYQIALDPATHIAAIATSCEFLQGANDAYQSQLSLVDLNTGVTSQVFERTLGIEQLLHGTNGMVGGASAVIGIDPVNHLVLQRSMYCPNLVGSYDLNARPCLELYDESGRLAKTVPNLFPAGFLDGSSLFNGVNGTARIGVAMGQQPGGSYIESFGVQPYSY